MATGDTFYEVEVRQSRRTLVLFLFLIIFYFAGIAVLYLAFFIFLFGLLSGIPLFSYNHLLIILAIATVIAILQWYDVKTSGAEFILDKLGARPPDPLDLYHKKFINTVEEMRLSAGCKKQIKPHVIPANAVNSCAVIASDGTAILAVTEGALGQLTREEIQAAVAHELAHIMSGDALFVTFSCALGNIFQRIADALTAEEEQSIPVFNIMSLQYNTGRGEPGIIVMLLASFMYVFVQFFSLLISRQREYLADAIAVEMTRNPEALARAIYKAHQKFSYLGDAGEVYSPIFIVPPESRGPAGREGWLNRLFATHPPTLERVKRLMDMANKSVLKAIQGLEEEDKEREAAREAIPSVDELFSANARMKGISDEALSETSLRRQSYDPAFAAASAEQAASATLQSSETHAEGEAVTSYWEVRDHKGQWLGPYPLAQLFAIPWFTGMTTVRPLGTESDSEANTFPLILEAFRNPDKRGMKRDCCPICGVTLHNSYTEGVPVRICPRCYGKMVPEEGIIRIIARRENKPSPHLLEKAHLWRKEHQVNIHVSVLAHKNQVNAKPENKSAYLCPLCGYGMIRRLFSYQYFIEIDNCKLCKQVWFDGNELEILQILIEEAGY
jgi:Zn-dependent protease with chaperone function/Zn-finger nucleic acid-binding protein